MNIIINSITLFHKYFIYFKTFLSSILSNLERIQITSKVKQEDIIPKPILKKEINKKLDNFLNIIIKILNKKKSLLNVSKQKFIKKKQRSEIVIISFFDNASNKSLLTSTFT